MPDVIDLQARRAPVVYTLRIAHFWDGRLEVAVEDLADDARSRASVADTLTRAALHYGAGVAEADELHSYCLKRIDALMGAEAASPEADELSRLADIVQSYETKRWPGIDLVPTGSDRDAGQVPAS